MSRLIRDTDIINAIEEWRSGLVCTPSQYADCVVDGTLETVREVIIDKAPTAYDVEAVVRELEQEIKYHAKAQLRCEDKGFEEGADRHRQKVIAFDTAIAIVKRGGRND